MGCFLVCFGSTKDGRKQRKQSQNKFHPHDNVRTVDYKPVQSAISSIQGTSENPSIKQISQVRDESEKELSFRARKKVTFDSNVKTHEHVTCGEALDLLLQKKPSQSKSSLEDSLITSSSGSYPPNYRYQNCRDSDDEYEELDCEDTDLDDDDGGLEDDGLYADDDEGIVRSRKTISVAHVFTEEADSTKPICALPDGEMKPIGSNQYARDRSAYVHPVLNPVENLTQWKAVKAKGDPQLKPQKENFVSDRETQVLSASEPSFNGLSFSFKSETDQSKKLNKEIAVDASLSNWLVPSESPVNKTSRNNPSIISPEKSMSQGSSSSRCQEDRPILGALTVEELKQFSASSAPRKSPSRSPDEIPIIGTVGTYWSRAVPAKDFGSASSLPSKKYQTRPASMYSYM
ncbi:uncharacterized protein LOC121252859 [Juglans microcarpa x Juglans regia]|uniref:uncharacterized protein LOC121252859 n=1 Tax=Juglans microcarpa x Juglans regia TaxID=2249226 RepID=UPI001B7E2733|nr:uncharacterized protein LOC121252859 [Juglans microcarpa x Juglans regia]